MIASGELSAAGATRGRTRRPALGAQDRRHPVRRHRARAMWCCTSRASSLPLQLQSPRTCRRKSKRLDTAFWAKLAPPISNPHCWSAATSPRAASIATCWKAYRMFANDHGWSHRLHEAVATGLTAEAAVERVPVGHPRHGMLRSDPIPYSARTGCTDPGRSRPIGLMRQLVRAGPTRRRAKQLARQTPFLIARLDGPPAALFGLRPQAAARPWCSRRAPPNSHVSIVGAGARHSFPAVGRRSRTAPPASPIPATAIIVDGTSGSIYGPAPSSEIESAYAERVRFSARGGQAQYSALRDPALRHQGRPADRV